MAMRSSLWRMPRGFREVRESCCCHERWDVSARAARCLQQRQRSCNETNGGRWAIETAECCNLQPEPRRRRRCRRWGCMVTALMWKLRELPRRWMKISALLYSVGYVFLGSMLPSVAESWCPEICHQIVFLFILWKPFGTVTLLSNVQLVWFQGPIDMV